MIWSSTQAVDGNLHRRRPSTMETSTNLTATLASVLVEKHGAKPLRSHEYSSSEVLDSFLKEAYQIVWRFEVSQK